MWKGEVLEKVEHRGWHRISQSHHMLFQNSQTIKKRAHERSSEKHSEGDRRGNKEVVMGHNLIKTHHMFA